MAASVVSLGIGHRTPDPEAVDAAYAALFAGALVEDDLAAWVMQLSERIAVAEAALRRLVFSAPRRWRTCGTRSAGRTPRSPTPPKGPFRRSAPDSSLRRADPTSSRWIRRSTPVLSHSEILSDRVRAAIDAGRWDDLVESAEPLREYETIRRGVRSPVCAHEREHVHHLLFRWDVRDGGPAVPLEVVVWDVWHGGFAEIAVWPWTTEGLALAQEWVDRNHAVFHVSGAAVRPGELAYHDHARFA